MKKIFLLIVLLTSLLRAQWFDSGVDTNVVATQYWVLNNGWIFDTTNTFSFYEPEVFTYRNMVLNDGGVVFGLNRLNTRVTSDRNLGLYDSQVLNINGRLGNKIDGSNYVSKAYDASSLYQHPIQSTGANQPLLQDFAYRFDGSQYLTLTPDSIQISTGRNVGSLDMNGYQKISDTMNTHFESTTLNLGANLVINSTFDGDTGWNLSGSWSIADNKATHVPSATDEYFISTIPIKGGIKYKVVFTVSGRTDGIVIIQIGGRSGIYNTTNATFTEYISTINTGSLAIYATATFDGSVSNVTVQEVQSDWVGYGNNSSYISGLSAHTNTYSNGITSSGAGDSTTNYTKLAPNKYEAIESGKKYTYENWVYDVGTTTGSNLVSDGTMENPASWNSNPASIEITAGVMRWTNVPPYSAIFDANSLTLGKRYKITFEIKNYVKGSVRYTNGTEGNTIDYIANGTYTEYLSYGIGVGIVFINYGDTTTLDIDNLVILEIVPTTLSLAVGDIKKSWTLTAGVWQKVAYNFLATSQTVGQDIRLYANQSSTLLLDDCGLYEYYPFSFSYWVKYPSFAGTNQNIFDKRGYDAVTGNILIMVPAGHFTFRSQDGYSYSDIWTSYPKNDNNWHFVTISVDRIDTTRMFIDGVLENFTTAFQGIGSSNTPTKFSIGSNLWGGELLKGSIGSLTIHRNKALTLAEHQALYQRGR